MSCGTHIVACVVALALAGPAAADEAKDRQAQDRQLYTTLRDVINRGADLYNSGDHSACYRLFEGALMAVRPQLGHKTALQQSITRGIASAERDPVMWRRAFTLRDVLDKIRDDLKPKGAGDKQTEKLGPPKTDEEAPEKKEAKPDDKKPEDKKPEDKKPEDKKSEDKKADDKDS